MQLAWVLARWSALPKSARVAAVSGAVIALATLVLAGVVTHPPRAALFATPLHAEQLSEVEERLASWNVAFTPTADNVIVDTRHRNNVLLKLSLAGVPHAHVETTGEALANVGVLTPQTVIDAQARSGLAGDVEIGLRGVDGVDDARVIVAPAKPAEFADDSARAASASVRLRLHPGVRLSRAAIGGIRAFVAASVEGLDADHVTILDDRGVALADAAEENDDAIEIQRSLQTALDAAFGEGAAIVRVHAETRGAQIAERDERRVPAGDRPIVQESSTESFDGENKRYRRADDRDDRGSETRETISQTRPGALVRLSTAVFVDAGRALELASVRELAAATVGYDAKRGDTLAVAAVDFHRTPVARKDPWWLLYGAVVPLLPALVFACGTVVAVRYAVPPLVSLLQSFAERASVSRTSQELAGFAPARVRTALSGEPPHAAAAIISALPAATAAAVLELYPPHEREKIVERMQRRHCPLVPNVEEVLRRYV